MSYNVNNKSNVDNEENPDKIYATSNIDIMNIGMLGSHENEFKAFEKEVLEYGSNCYSVDSSLEPHKIQEAYKMYLKAKRGTETRFLILGRKHRDQDRNLLPSDEHSPSIDLSLIEKLGVMDNNFDKKNGSVFSYPYEHWTWLIQDACVLGLMYAETEFRIISQINISNFWKSEHNCMTIFAREIKTLMSFGYELRKAQFGAVAVCIDEKKAQGATLRTLIEATQPLFNYDNLKEFYRSLPDEVKSEE